ncbi:MAG TPA: glutamine-hydrolyzing GMP synthase [Ignavibacteriales bacterium]|nr:glutamine-hydrolyzing GMP synthase [Ignavibacteriales bacterium]HOL80964.1 glutamine-hydrolyzing GMP synthase [Ignavibacteriales bacterium]HOM64699.1 glutamine-hydrolyzing GMP synthase [Ignavibacteriales bacterium]HPD66769.1 glutamine-hydrolyzing GMP synthase [Ignavibacteriales bacterium]HPP32744.1 glutamine-hydrolyzing GMP synthase [Ignavibacteriales bacterium]
MITQNKILVLDFGSQYTQLIARRIRELKVYCEIFPYNASIDKILEFNPNAIILSGSPSSIYYDNAPFPDEKIFTLNLPILGICYGMQLVANKFGGKVTNAQQREYGRTELNIINFETLFKDIPQNSIVWMSHGDKLESISDNFIILANTSNTPFAAIKHKNLPIYAIQFHPEVYHSVDGINILSNFVFNIAKCSPDWQMSSFIEYQCEEIRKTVGNDTVICALSGGVDSSVVALLLHKAIGNQLHCIFVDNGLLRLNEAKKVDELFRKKFNLNLKTVDASNLFLEKLKGITNPEQKRKIIGHTFIEVFEKEAKSIPNAKFLAQGTLYPDVIESVSFKGPSAVIKSHHNVGGLPERMNFRLIEPLRELFKDEVRILGKELGLPDEICYRQPFPGPGLAVRIIGEITKDKLDTLRLADDIIVTEVKNAGFYYKTWQTFGVLLPVKSVGVMGDERSYENVLAIRSVDSVDGMTADWSKLPYDLLGKISNRIINEVKGINRVVYDISSKPPSTIEWE